jgi:hypothetical protein
MSMAPPSLDQALAVARRLSVRDQARLIAQLAATIADTPATPTTHDHDAWNGWAQLRADIATHYPDARLGTRLDQDRREREIRIPSPES